MLKCVYTKPIDIVFIYPFGPNFDPTNYYFRVFGGNVIKPEKISSDTLRVSEVMVVIEIIEPFRLLLICLAA